MKEEILSLILFVIFITFILIFLTNYILVPFLSVVFVISVLIGCGHALYNYGLSLRNNVKFEAVLK
jgi:fatty acid desaturase